MRYPKTIQKLVEIFTKLPGVGRKTAERYVFHMLAKWSSYDMQELSEAMELLKKDITSCSLCGSITDHGENPCSLCKDPLRNTQQLCIVGSPKDVFSFESISEYRGVYHVLPALLSPLDGRGEETLGIGKLIHRIQSENVQEIILALDSSVEGDATCLYLKDVLEQYPVTFYRLAFGIPVGSSLEYVDGGTLARAFSSRAKF